MNILYLLYSFTTGGTERLVSDICEEMVRRGHKVYLYIVNDLYDQEMLDSMNPSVTVFLQKRQTGGGQKLQTLLNIAKYIRSHRIDAVHCNSLDAPELLLLLPLIAPRAKVLYTVHGMHQISAKSRLQILYRNFLCHRVIGISGCVCEDILSAGIDPRKAVTIPNAINFSKFPSPSQKSFDLSRPVIGNVARIQPQVKGQDILIRAISILKQDYPHIQCLFAGAPAQGHPEELDSLVELTHQLGLEKNITFLGGIQNIPDFLSKIDIFALPSRSEGFGISLVEAMAMEVPCIASHLEGPSEVLCSGKFGVLFQPEDPRNLAERLHQMLEEYAEHKQIARTAGSYVRNQYNIESMCDRLEALIK